MTTLPKSTDPATLVVLLDAMADNQPGPSIPRWQREGISGFARSWVTCPKCKGTGAASWKGRTVKCDHAHCHGEGGWAGDPMATTKAAGPVDTEVDQEQTVTDFYRIVRDMGVPELDRLDYAIDHAFSLDADLEREARQAHPCWQQLEDALHGLSLASPSHYRCLVWTHLDKLPLGPNLTVDYNEALVILGLALGDTFRVPRYVLVKADEQLRGERARKANSAGRHALSPWQRDQRDAKIRDLAARGDKPTAIGRAVGLDRRTVEKILAREKEAA